MVKKKTSRKIMNIGDYKRTRRRQHKPENFYVLSGCENMRINDVMYLMQFSKKGKDRTREQVLTAMENSMCFGIFSIEDNRQIGFARAITDYATMYYVTDVVTDPDYRKMGAGEQLMRELVHSGPLGDLRGVLITKDAQSLYKKVDFEGYEGTFMHRPELAAAEGVIAE